MNKSELLAMADQMFKACQALNLHQLDNPSTSLHGTAYDHAEKCAVTILDELYGSLRGSMIITSVVETGESIFYIVERMLCEDHEEALELNELRDALASRGYVMDGETNDVDIRHWADAEQITCS